MPLIGPFYYAVQLVKDGPRNACKIWYGPSCDPDTGEELDRSPRWYCILRGHDEPIEEVMIEQIGDQRPVMPGDFITEKEYLRLLALREDAMQNDPSLPWAAPRSPIDHLETKPLF
jgi:hypothetical protein